MSPKISLRERALTVRECRHGLAVDDAPGEQIPEIPAVIQVENAEMLRSRALIEHHDVRLDLPYPLGSHPPEIDRNHVSDVAAVAVDVALLNEELHVPRHIFAELRVVVIELRVMPLSDVRSTVRKALYPVRMIGDEHSVRSAVIVNEVKYYPHTVLMRSRREIGQVIYRPVLRVDRIIVADTVRILRILEL